MKSLEFATDLLVLSGRTEVEGYSDRIIQRTPPDEPQFWFGNRTIFRKPPPHDVAPLIKQFHADHPKARHICLSWDIPNLRLHKVEPVLAGSDLTVEQADTLTLTDPLHRAKTPDGLTLRAFEQASDWRQSAEVAFHQSLAEAIRNRACTVSTPSGSGNTRPRSPRGGLVNGLGGPLTATPLRATWAFSTTSA